METPKQMSIKEIANIVNGEIIGDSDINLTGLGKIEEADSKEITFFANPKYKQFLSTSKAGTILVNKNFDVSEYSDKTFIKVEDAYFSFVKLFSIFYPQGDLLPLGISSLAYVDNNARVGTNVRIGPNVYVGQDCRIGNNVILYPGVVLLKNIEVGDDSVLYPNVSIRENCKIGKRVILHNGAVIGSDGFGFAFQEGRYHKIPQMGIVILEDDVELGANVTIDRATLGETRICSGTKLDNLVQIAHNVEVGSHTVMAAQCGVAGSTKIGSYVMFGGQVGVAGHSQIGDKVQVGAQSGVAKNAADGEVLFGSPARPMMKTKRIEAVINNLPEMAKKLSALQREVEKLKEDLKNRE